jgi:hypothetical protein
LLPRVSVLDEVDKQGFDSHGESIFRGQLQLGSSSGHQEKATIGPATRAGRRVRERESLGGATSVCFRGIQGVQVKGPKGAKSKAVEAIVLTSGKNKRKNKTYNSQKYGRVYLWPIVWCWATRRSIRVPFRRVKVAVYLPEYSLPERPGKVKAVLVKGTFEWFSIYYK